MLTDGLDLDLRVDGKMLKDETLNILLAGRDTTACTLTFSVFALAEHPVVLERLRKEVLDVVGPRRRPTYEDIREMKYMRAFINEVLRLYPPVYVVVVLSAVSSGDVYVSDGIAIAGRLTLGERLTSMERTFGVPDLTIYRCSIKGMTWKSNQPGEPDFYIPPRTRCLYSVLLMHRRKDLWGPDGTSPISLLHSCTPQYA